MPTLPEERLYLWKVGFPIVRAICSFLAPWRLEGREHIPTSGAFILVCNHINWKDPPWLEFATGRAIRYMAKRELFQVPVVGFVLRGIGAFPVRRGEADRGALQTALAVLAAGQPLGFFPEGHRSESGQLIRARTGIAYVALHSGAPMVPIAVTGTREARFGRFWRRDITFRAGKPFRVSDLVVSSGDPQAIADAIMRRVAALLPAEMRGVYREQGTTR
jgi:1-acyl-sn-glycerol-3-phosphate acyltransferase